MGLPAYFPCSKKRGDTILQQRLHRQLGFSSDSQHLIPHISWFFLLSMVGKDIKNNGLFGRQIFQVSSHKLIKGMCSNPDLSNSKLFTPIPGYLGLPWWLSGKETACSEGDLGSILGSGRSPGEGNGNPLQYSCLENPMDRGAWWVTVHGVTKSWT